MLVYAMSQSMQSIHSIDKNYSSNYASPPLLQKLGVKKYSPKAFTFFFRLLPYYCLLLNRREE